MKQNNLKFSTLKSVVVGGSACPPAMIDAFRDGFGVHCKHAWGMTEMSPLGSFCTLKAKHEALPREKKHEVECKQGRTIYGVEMKIVDGEGKELPRDGKAFGDLLVRGRQPLARRMVSHGRRRYDRPGRLHADHRSLEGRDQVGRRMDQLDRPGEHRRGASGDR